MNDHKTHSAKTYCFLAKKLALSLDTDMNPIAGRSIVQQIYRSQHTAGHSAAALRRRQMVGHSQKRRCTKKQTKKWSIVGVDGQTRHSSFCILYIERGANLCHQHRARSLLLSFRRSLRGSFSSSSLCIVVGTGPGSICPDATANDDSPQILALSPRRGHCSFSLRSLHCSPFTAPCCSWRSVPASTWALRLHSARRSPP